MHSKPEHMRLGLSIDELENQYKGLNKSCRSRMRRTCTKTHITELQERHKYKAWRVDCDMNLYPARAAITREVSIPTDASALPSFLDL